MGTYGDFGIFSFNGNKIITTSGGGALIAKNIDQVEKARFLATQARDSAPHYEHSQIGYNYRMSNVSAGIGRGQMEVLDLWIEKRRRVYNLYFELLEKEEKLSFLKEKESSFSNRWLSTFLFKSYEQREFIRLELGKLNIESRPLWKPMHLQPVFQKYETYLNGNSEKLFELGLCLPSGSNLKQNELSFILKHLAIILHSFD
jgi:Predicted pyridoxal phosphate-dependent enzyme apparently involved in regulation of cell wall biogenesis